MIEEFINVDPYYQILNGDNSLLSNKLKKKTILAIKKYSEKDPFFYKFDHELNLEGFYNIELDEFFIEEFENALEFDNHYIFLIIFAILSTIELSENMTSFLRKKILDNCSPYYKSYIIKAFKDDPVFLINVLKRIKSEKLKDGHDDLKDNILRILYPIHINSKEVIEYLFLYTNKVGGFCHYLYNTDYKDKYSLINKIYELSFDETKTPSLSLPANTKGFIEDYFLETLLEYEKSIDAKEIYQRLKHFQSFNKSREIQFNSYRYSITDEVKDSEDKLERLTNELFSMYLDDMLETGNSIYTFQYFFNYRVPTKSAEIVIDKINSKNNLEKNRALLGYLFSYNRDYERLNIIAEKYGLEEDLDEWRKPQQWEIEEEEHKRNDKKEKENHLFKNEEYYNKKTDEQLRKDFPGLFYVSELIYYDEYIEDIQLKKRTYDRVKNLIKNVASNKPIEPELLTLFQLAKIKPNTIRNIDILYYVSSELNDYNNPTVELSEYLYMISFQRDYTGSAKYMTFVDRNNISFSIETLKKFITLLLKRYTNEIEKVFLKYLEKVENIELLKKLAKISSTENSTAKDNIIFNFVEVFNLDFSLKELKKLLKISEKESIKNCISALITFSEDKKENFTRLMASKIYFLFKGNFDNFDKKSNEIKIKFIDFMMNAFNTEESIKFVGGLQSEEAQCASFLQRNSLFYLNLECLRKLFKKHNSINDIWKDRIASKINELEQIESDKAHNSYPIEKIKDFIISEAIISKSDFYTDVCLKIEDLKTRIEDNRDNDKDPFYDGTNPKVEDSCRDVILQRLKYKYEYDLELTKEKHEANNRADINVKYKANDSFEVQIECKRDDNQGINTGISKQLVGKYFSSEVEYGIYLVFYFGDKKDKDLLLSKIQADVPEEYKNNIKIILIDLVR